MRPLRFELTGADMAGFWKVAVVALLVLAAIWVLLTIARVVLTLVFGP